MSNYTVTYNGITDKSVGCHAKKRPSVPAPQRRIAVATVPGRDGSYYDATDCFEDIAIQITFSFLKRDRSQWAAQYRAIKKWLLSGDNGDLKFSDDVGYHYRVRSVQITSTDRVTWSIGEVTAVFTCDGYTYLDSGDTPIALQANLQNDYSLSKPIYTITGNGECTLTVNGYSMAATIGGNLTIDTERMLAMQDGSTWVNTTVSGDYENLWLKPGMNYLSATSGFTVMITPQWRCV